MEFQEIKELIALIDQSSLRSFSLSNNGAIIAMSKNDGPLAETTSSAAPVEAPAAKPVSSSAPSVTQESAAPASAAQPKPQGQEVTAPLVGIFYASGAPDKPPFVTVGSKVESGDVLCIIEAMKVMNEVVSPYSGTVLEIYAQNEEVVGFGQPLFLIG